VWKKAAKCGKSTLETRILLIPLILDRAGSQEVAGSIPASSTNKIKGLRVPRFFPSLRFPPTFAEHLPIFYRETFRNIEGSRTKQVFPNATSGESDEFHLSE
jgi:hypothetical protein